MSPKPRPKTPPATSKGRPAPARTTGTKKPAAGRAAAAAKPRFPIAWVVTGAVIVTVIAVVLIGALGGDDNGHSSAGGSTAPASAELVRNTRLAKVPLLTEEGVATHTHTTLVVMVNGKQKQVPAFIGIDAASGHIAALHTHDTSGLVHLESAKENDSYTLEQFLTVWGMPKDAAGRCAFFGAASPCTLAVTSKDSGTVGLDVKLADYDTLTLTVTSG